MNKKLVKLKIKTSNEEIICILHYKSKDYYFFESQYGPFSLSVNDIECIDDIGMIKEQNILLYSEIKEND